MRAALVSAGKIAAIASVACISCGMARPARAQTLAALVNTRVPSVRFTGSAAAAGLGGITPVLPPVSLGILSLGSMPLQPSIAMPLRSPVRSPVNAGKVAAPLPVSLSGVVIHVTGALSEGRTLAAAHGIGRMFDGGSASLLSEPVLAGGEEDSSQRRKSYSGMISGVRWGLVGDFVRTGTMGADRMTYPAEYADSKYGAYGMVDTYRHTIMDGFPQPGNRLEPRQRMGRAYYRNGDISPETTTSPFVRSIDEFLREAKSSGQPDEAILDFAWVVFTEHAGLSDAVIDMTFAHYADNPALLGRLAGMLEDNRAFLRQIDPLKERLLPLLSSAAKRELALAYLDEEGLLSGVHIYKHIGAPSLGGVEAASVLKVLRDNSSHEQFDGDLVRILENNVEHHLKSRDLEAGGHWHSVPRHYKGSINRVFDEALQRASASGHPGLRAALVGFAVKGAGGYGADRFVAETLMDPGYGEDRYARLDGIIAAYDRLDPTGQASAAVMTVVYTRLPALIARDPFKRQVRYLQSKGAPGLTAMKELHRGLNRKISMFDGARASLDWLGSVIRETENEPNERRDLDP